MNDESKPMREPTGGERLMGVTFNPSGDPDVNTIKRHCAELADFLLECSKKTSDAHKAVMFDHAITQLMDAQMWAVKAATWKGG